MVRENCFVYWGRYATQVEKAREIEINGGREKEIESSCNPARVVLIGIYRAWRRDKHFLILIHIYPRDRRERGRGGEREKSKSFI